jgi:hypothetical protein
VIILTSQLAAAATATTTVLADHNHNLIDEDLIDLEEDDNLTPHLALRMFDADCATSTENNCDQMNSPHFLDC